MDSCQPDQVLDDGLICCNYTICDQYCYEDKCWSPKKVWFCNEGLVNILFIKFVPSIMFAIIGFITRCIIFDPPNVTVIRLNEWFYNRFLFVLLMVFNLDLPVNFLLFASIGVLGCLANTILDIILSCIYIFPFLIFIYFDVFKHFLPFCECDLFTRFSVNLFAHVKLFKILTNTLLNIWIVIFTLTGYYAVFDVFAYILNKNYRKEADYISNT